MRVYLGADGSHEFIRDHAGYYVMYAEHDAAGQDGGRRGVINAMSRPFAENGELIVSFTLQNAGRYLPKWVA